MAFEAVAFIVISNAERQARWRAIRDAEIKALRAATIKAELVLAQAENHVLRQRILDLEKALVRRESAVKSAQTKAASEVARLREKNKELQVKLRHMWDWHNNEITKAGGLTFKASSLIAKALHPDSMPSEEVKHGASKSLLARSRTAANLWDAADAGHSLPSASVQFCTFLALAPT